MSSQDYFQVYIETIAETFRRVKKIGFKKLHLVKDLIETAESTIKHTQGSSKNKSMVG